MKIDFEISSPTANLSQSRFSFSPAILIMKTVLVFLAPLALETPKLFFLKAHLRWAFKKNSFYGDRFCSFSIYDPKRTKSVAII
jgi:hypothetical protein